MYRIKSILDHILLYVWWMETGLDILILCGANDFILGLFVMETEFVGGLNMFMLLTGLLMSLCSFFVSDLFSISQA